MSSYTRIFNSLFYLSFIIISFLCITKIASIQIYLHKTINRESNTDHNTVESISELDSDESSKGLSYERIKNCGKNGCITNEKSQNSFIQLKTRENLNLISIKSDIVFQDNE